MKKLIAAILLAVPAFAKAQMLPLDEAIKIALQNNFDVISASQSKEIYRLQNHIGNAGMLPTITLSGTAQYGLNSLRQQFSSGLSVNNPSVDSRNYTANGALTWTVFDGLRMFAVKRRLSLQEDIAGLSLQDQLLQTTSQVIINYTTFAAELKRLQGLERTAAYLKEVADLADAKQKIGTGNKQEALQAKTDYNAQRSLMLRQQAYLQQLRIQLNILMNRDPAIQFVPDTNIVINRSLALEESLNNANTANPAVLIADKNVAVLKANLKEQNSYQMPRVNVGLAYGYNYSGSSAGFALFNQTNGLTANAGLIFPIFDGWKVRRNIKTARIQYENAKYATDFTKLRIQGEIRAAYEVYLRALDVLALEEENIKLAEENMSIATERYKTGLGTLIESRAAALTYSDAQTRFTQAQSEAKTSETNLLVLTGQLVK